MRKYIILAITFFFIVLPVYSSNMSALERATIDVARDVGESVVSISSIIKGKAGSGFYFGSPFEHYEEDPFHRFFEEFFGAYPEREYKRMGLGSGVIINKEGYILTNEHVVSGATKIKVKLSDGREFDAEVKGTDGRSDLAVIKINASKLKPARLGNSDNLKIGQWVVAIGNPFGPYIENPEPTVTVGVVSALNRYLPALGRREVGYDDLIQTDAAINPGNSGGPLVNLKGDVIGINTAIITSSGGYQGLGFAIPISKTKRILGKLLKGQEVSYGWLGVNIQDLNEDLRSYFEINEKKGVIVLKVYKDSPAEKKGLKEGDLILSFNDQPVTATRDLVRVVSSTEVGSIVPVKIMRSNKTLDLMIEIGKMPQDFKSIEESIQIDEVSFRGLVVDDINSAYKRKFRLKTNSGVVVIKVKDNSPAEKSGFMAGDIIYKIENKKINSKGDFLERVSKVRRDCLVKTDRGYFVLKSK